MKIDMEQKNNFLMKIDMEQKNNFLMKYKIY